MQSWLSAMAMRLTRPGAMSLNSSTIKVGSLARPAPPWSCSTPMTLCLAMLMPPIMWNAILMAWLVERWPVLLRPMLRVTDIEVSPVLAGNPRLVYAPYHDNLTCQPPLSSVYTLGWSEGGQFMTAETSDARGDVRGLVAKLAAHVRPTCSELWDEAQAFLAAEGVQAREVSAYDLAVLDDAAETLDRLGDGSAGLRTARARIASALSQQPEAQAAEAQAQGGGEVVAWRVPVLQSPFGERLDHGVRDELVLVLHRGTHGWQAAGQGHARLARQIYVKDVEPLCAASYEVAVVGLSGGGWRTVWARSDDDVTHPAPQSTPPAEAQLTYKGVPIGPMQTFADIERQAIAPAGAAEDMVLDAIERRESSAPVGGDRWKSLIGQWQRRAEAAGYDGVEDALDALAHRQPEAWITPGGDVSRSVYWCLGRCLPGQQPRPLYAAPQHPAAADGSDAQAAEIEALRAESAEAAKVLRGALDARTDGEPLRVLAIRASNALYWRNERAERAEARADKLLAAAKRLTQEVGRLQQQYDERTACVIAHRGSALACSDAVRSAYSDERRRADRLAEALRNSADALERLAFAIRAPNAHTPRLVELAIAMRAAAHPGGSDNGR